MKKQGKETTQPGTRPYAPGPGPKTSVASGGCQWQCARACMMTSSFFGQQLPWRKGPGDRPTTFKSTGIRDVHTLEALPSRLVNKHKPACVSWPAQAAWPRPARPQSTKSLIHFKKPAGQPQSNQCRARLTTTQCKHRGAQLPPHSTQTGPPLHWS
jgi:hypothetical protein